MFKYIKFEKVETEYTTLEFRGDADGVEVNHFSVDAVSIESDNEDAIDALIASQAVECVEITQDEFKALTAQSAQVLRILAQVDEKYSKDVSVLTSKYPLQERETWALQLEEARAYKDSSDEDDAPFLKTLADAEGASIDDFADAVIANAKTFSSFMAQKLVDKRAFKRELTSSIGL